MSVTIVVELVAKAGCRGDLEAWVAAAESDTRRAQGFETLDTFHDSVDPDALVLLERWATSADYDAYTVWRHRRGDLRQLGELLGTDVKVRRLTCVAGRGSETGESA